MINRKTWLNFFRKNNVFVDSINIVCIADLHGRLRNENPFLPMLANADAVFLLGDNSYEDIRILDKYLDRNKTYGILGNHDTPDILDSFNIPNINGKNICVGKFHFVGWEGSHKYKNNMIGQTQSESESFCDQMLSLHGNNIDCLLSHDGPYREGIPNMAHVGLKGISKYMKLTSCVNIHGHLHESELLSPKEKCIYQIERIKLCKTSNGECIIAQRG